MPSTSKTPTLPPVQRSSSAPASQPRTPLATASFPDDSHAEAAAEPPTKEELVASALQRCRDYIFHQPVVNKALVRLIVYAKFGPGVVVDDRVQLMGPHRVLHGFEEKLLLAEEERTLVVDVYGGTLSSTKLTGTQRPVDRDSQADMNRMKNRLFFDALELSRAELKQVLDSIDFEAALKRSVSALSTPSAFASPAKTRAAAVIAPKKDPLPAAIDDAISTALLNERRRRIRMLKKATPQLGEVRTDKDVTDRTVRHFYNKTAPKAYKIRSFEDPKDVLRSLHRSAYSITDFSNRNNPDLTLNVRCLRADFEPDPNRPGWDGYCCVRNAQASKITTLR